MSTTGDGRIWIVGVGGIGAVVGYRLGRAGLAPLLIDGWAEHVAAINERGLRLAGQFDDAAMALPARRLEALAGLSVPPAIVLLCVKSFQTESALAAVAPRLAAHTVLVSLQNGMNEETIAAAIGHGRTVGCVVIMDGGLLAPGVAAQENPHERRFMLGGLDDSADAAVEKAGELLAAVGEVEVSRNIRGELWAKLVHNCMVNAVCALTGLSAARALRDRLIWPCVHRLGREAVLVSRAEGVALGGGGLFGLGARDFLEDERAGIVERAILGAYPRSENLHPSMAQDIAKGRPTEIGFLNGWIVTRARRAGIETPANAEIVDLIRRVERGELAPREENRRLLGQA